MNKWLIHTHMIIIRLFFIDIINKYYRITKKKWQLISIKLSCFLWSKNCCFYYYPKEIWIKIFNNNKQSQHGVLKIWPYVYRWTMVIKYATYNNEILTLIPLFWWFQKQISKYIVCAGIKKNFHTFSLYKR